MLLDNYKKQSPIVGVAGLGGGINSYIFLSSGGDYVISKSLRFDGAGTSKLTRTQPTSNRRTWTWAAWVKRNNVSTRTAFFNVGTAQNDSGYFAIEIESAGDMRVAGWNTLYAKTNAVFRDPSSWYHFVIAFDTTQVAAADQIKIYQNGNLLTKATETAITHNAELPINSANVHNIGYLSQSNQYGDKMFADIHFVDGQALAPTSFGQTDSDGVWQPKKFSGNHGTNGFHLDFKDTASIGNDAAGSNNWTANNITAVVPGLATADQGMDVLTYTGNGGTKSVTGLAFQPDFVWYKNRTSAGSHKLFDVIRGVQNVEYSNYTQGGPVATSLTAFTSNGFNVGSDAGSNTNTNNYVAWCWKAGGNPSSNDTGTIVSSVSVSTTYGFSICTYTGIFGNKTVGHGLGKVPSMMFLKCTSHSDGWSVYHASLGNTNYLRLDSTAMAVSTSPVFNSTSPTSSVFTIGQTGLVNETGRTYVAYVWSEIAGFSKFGTYSGGTNPKTITTGFKPKFLIFKRTDTANHWIMIDNVRGGIKKLAADTSNAENHNATIGDDSQNVVEFLEDGFKLTTTNAGTNVSGGTYVYAAWASKPDQSELDVLIDSPSQSVADETDTGLGGQITGNYATYNPVRPGSGTKSNGALTVTGTGQVPDVTSIAPNSGKWYAEIKWDSGTYARIGLQDVNIPTSDFGGVNGQSYRYESNSGNVQPGGQTYSTYAAGDIIGVAFDCDAGKLWLAKNGTWQNSGDPAAGSGAVSTNLVSGSYYAPASSSGSGSSVFTLNAGQRAFKYAAPTGFKCLTVENLSTPTIADGSKYFDTKLYEGDGLNLKTISGYNFSPDFLWVKERTNTGGDYSNRLINSVMGADISLSSNSTAIKRDSSAESGGGVETFTSDGFTIQQGTSNNNNQNNDNSTYVAWAWDGGSSNTTIAPGGANDLVYDQTQRWSNSLTSSNGFISGYDATKAFNGTTSGNHTGSNGGGTLTFAPNLTIPADSIIEGYFGSGSTTYMDVTINGVTNNSTPGGQWVKVNYDGSTTLTSLTIYRTGGGNSADLRGLKINGKLLVDDNVTPSNVPSIQSIYSANQAAGFSVVTYVGNSINNSTIAHGLNSAPELIITKNRDDTYNWIVYSAELADTKVLALDDVTGEFTPSGGYYGTVGSSSYELVQGSSNLTNVNNSGDNYVAYCFSQVSGYSAMGSFSGAGSSGPFIYTGMRPSWIMIKRSDNTGNWTIWDTTRQDYNAISKQLFANTSGVEQDLSVDAIDALSNGFMVRSSSSFGGGTFVYLAFAEHPFKSARAR